MSNPSSDESLAQTVDWLRTGLQAYCAGETAADSEQTAMPRPASLRNLSQQLGLSSFEQKILLLCTATELDPDIGNLYAQAQGNASYLAPTFALALSLFADSSWDALSPQGPLRYWRLLEINHALNRPLTLSPLQADERIVNYLIGLNQLDHRLIPFLLPLPPDDIGIDLPPSQQAHVDQALAQLAQAQEQVRWPVIQLVGPDSISKNLVAHQIASRLGVQLYNLPPHLIPANTRELEDFARLWYRESLLMPLALYINANDLGPESETNGLDQRLRQFLYRSNGLFLLDTREVWYNMSQYNVALDIHKPTPLEQIQTWQALLPAEFDHLPARLAAQFNLNLPTIAQVIRTVSLPNDENDVDPSDLKDGLWQACLAYTRPRLDLLAQRITPKATWDDIVLPPAQIGFLSHIADQVEQRSKVYEEWGFRRRNTRGLGITVLFAGESGTGKTMAAEILANHLKLNLYRIDLSAVVSKYIGETEKNLRQLFDAAEDGGALLFFDEADSLFGKRSEVKDSHDRYANIEVNYLLQRLEAYQGLAILATNMKSGLDEAFTRRLRFSVTFQTPDVPHRNRIWQKAFPTETPVGELDYEYLARKFKLAGGSIYNIALNAAFMAATANTPVSMKIVLEAVRIELTKDDRLLNERDFIWQAVNDA